VKNIQEWQQENSIRAFPFSEKTISANGIPKDFIVDLKFFPDYYSNNSIYLSSVIYSSQNDSYVLEFKYSQTEEIAIISGSISRRRSIQKNGITTSVNRKGDQITLKYSNPVFSQITGYATKYAVCMFTIGSSWDNALQNLSNLDKESSLLDSSVINPGSKGFRRVFIQKLPDYITSSNPNFYVAPSIPEENEWGREIIQKIKAGPNVVFSKDLVDPNLIIVSATPVATTSNDSTLNTDIKFINNVGPDDTGRFRLNTVGCLTKIERPETRFSDDSPDEQQDIKLLNSVQLLSDCLPCCGCEKYRAYTAAIERRSRKLKEVCDLLVQMVTSNTELYNDAVNKINKERRPICRVRNLRVFEDQFRISVQNTCSVPIYVDFRLSVVGGFGIEPQSFSILEFDPSLESDKPPLIYSSIEELPALTTTPKDYYNNSPDLPSGFFGGFVIGSNSEYGDIKPIMPGSYTDITFVANFPVFDLKDNNLTIKCESNGIYGGTVNDDQVWTGTYGCKKDVWIARYEYGPVLQSKSCGGELISRQTYRVIQLDQ
jgi:hypothetical protein